MQAATNIIFPSTYPRKRNRAPLSCHSCHTRRVKCDRRRPCQSCIDYGRVDTCVFAAKPLKQKRSAGGGGGGDDDDDAIQNKAYRCDQVTTSLNSSETSQILSLPSLNLMVDEIEKEHTPTYFETNAAHATYSDEAFLIMQAAHSDMPNSHRVKYLLHYYAEHVNWYFELLERDEIHVWLDTFLDRLNQQTVPVNKVKKGDATRLCMVMCMIVASVQVVDQSFVEVCFIDVTPPSLARTTLDRRALTRCYEHHIQGLIKIAEKDDGPSSDLLRTKILYIHYLKNQGRHSEWSDKGLSLSSITSIVTSCSLHLDPSTLEAQCYSEQQMESLRRLFWTYYCFSRMMALHLGQKIDLVEERITTKYPAKESFSPVYGRKLHVALLLRIGLNRIAAKLSLFIHEKSSEEKMKEIQTDLDAWSSSLPREFQSDFSSLPAEVSQLDKFDLQRRIVRIIFYSIQSSLHRVCYSSKLLVSKEQAERSRMIGRETAISMIKLLEDLRLILVSDNYLRFFYMPYYLVESAITLILTSLIELKGAISSLQGLERVLNNANNANRWAHRAHRLLHSLPTDFLPASQGFQLLSRVLPKFTRILEAHQQALQYQSITTTPLDKNLSEQLGSTPADCVSSSIISSDPSLATCVDSLQSSDYSDFGLDIFNDLTRAIPNLGFTNSGSTGDYHEPVGIPAGMEEQMDMWLESLQHIV